MYNKGKQLSTSLSYMGQNVKNIHFWLFGGLVALQWSHWAYLAFQLSSHPYLCTCQIRKQSDNNFLSLNPKYGKYIIIFIFGGSWGTLTSNPGLPKFQSSKTSYVQQGKTIIISFSYMHFWLLGGGDGWPFNNQTAWAHLASQLCFNLEQYT